MIGEKQKHVKILRNTRKIHRYSGIFLFVFLFAVGTTGLLLGWKKNTGGLILAHTAQGSSNDPKDWISLDSLVQQVVSNQMSQKDGRDLVEIDRMEIRPEKGIVKVTFKNNYKGLQLDATTGKVLKEEYRYSDLIEHIHDGTWMDRMVANKYGIFKLVYVTLCGMGLLIFTVTGFWLWYGPKVIKRYK